MAEHRSPKELTFFVSRSTHGRFLCLIEYQKTSDLYSFFSKKNRDFPVKILENFAQNVQSAKQAVSAKSGGIREVTTINCESFVNKNKMLIKLWICG